MTGGVKTALTGFHETRSFDSFGERRRPELARERNNSTKEKQTWPRCWHLHALLRLLFLT